MKKKPIAKVLPCPSCGSTNLEFRYSLDYGHGDCSFSNARIQCNNCTTAKGDGSNYGDPTEEDELKACKIWNQRG